MADPFIAEVKIFAGNFAPRGWAFCNGQLLQIAQNTALFSLIGTTYGGDGRTTTGLPNLQGRMPMHPGRGPGLTPRRLGETGGFDAVTLTTNQIPNHNHTLTANAGAANQPAPAANYVGSGSNNFHTAVGSAPLAPEVLPSQGGGGSHDNDSPYLVLNFIIALTGVYPSRA